MRLSNSISSNLRQRLLSFTFAGGARRTWIDVSGICPVLRGQDGKGQFFEIEIGGPEQAWLDALEQLAHDAFVESETAGLLRLVQAARLQPRIAQAGPVRLGDECVRQTSSTFSRPSTGANNAKQEGVKG